MKGKNIFKVFSIFLCLLSIFVLLNYPQKAHAIIFFSETWDSGTPAACWPCKSYPCTTSFNGWLSADYNSGWGTMPNCGRSSTRAHSGTYSYYQYRASGAPQTCDIAHQFTTPYPTAIHLRFYLYLTTNWNSYGDLEVVHWIFTNIVAVGRSFRMNFMGDGQYNCGDGGIHMIPEGEGNRVWWFNDSNWDVCGVNYKELIGAWHSIEYRMQISGSNIILTEWIDGVLRRGPTTGPGQDSANNFNKITISGWENTSIAHVGDFYIDDIVVSDSYIGSGSGDTQAPTVPDGLSAQAISSSQINLSWTASTDNVGVTEYRIYRNNTQVATTTSNTSYSDTGLSSSTTYTYNVSAYDAAGNNSAQSSSASATTQAGGGSGGNNSNGDTTASGGSGCGFVKDYSKGQGAKGEGLVFAMMLIMTLVGTALLKKGRGYEKRK